ARIRSINSGLLATLNGSPITLPAGRANASLRLEWRGNRATSTSAGVGPVTVPTRRLRRDDLVAQLALQIPLISNKAIGNVGAEVSGALRHVTASRALHDVGYALNWRPDDRFSLRAAVNREQVAPPPGALTDALVTIDNVRLFDFIRQETVLVTYLTGGNPDLGIERRRSITVGATWRPFDEADLDLSVDYLNIVGRGAFAALPPVNADVQAAFPDRYQRDGDGRLIAVDARPVPFRMVKRQELRSGATFNHTFGRSALKNADAPAGDSKEQGGLANGWRVNAFVAHQWTLQSERQARSGLPVIDLLDGGALGYGGGQPRHRVQFGGGVVHRGVGLQASGDWTGSSKIAAGTLAAPDELRFESQMLLDARLFANLGPLMPERPWAKGLRITLEVENAFDSKRRVRNSSGDTPLGYQPYLLNPLGRTVSLSLRKVF
ncbi:MAG: TonB-dependent receptor, partial [Hyphomicrobium sp.]|nr:TonB-dependent receptor [Hyphomicrobium sp.]